jgi:hypothetical protein
VANERLPEFRVLAQLPNLPRQLRSTQVLVRFCLRTSTLVIFAAFGSIGFGRSLAALLWMAIILCAVVGLRSQGGIAARQDAQRYSRPRGSNSTWKTKAIRLSNR